MADKNQEILRKLFREHNVGGVSIDTRSISAGDAFFAIKGGDFDGNDFIEQAFNRGARLAFTEDKKIKSKLPANVTDRVIITPDVRRDLGIGASIFYPKLPKYLVGVTGTNGKSSIVSFCRQLAISMGSKALSLGTMGSNTSACNIVQDGALTTMDIISIRKTLHEFVRQGGECAFLEISSHGLDQRRIEGLEFDVVAFSSFAPEHLDYHGTAQNYLATKLQLFNYLKQDGTIIINNLMDVASKVRADAYNKTSNVISIGGDDVVIDEVICTLQETRIDFTFENTPHRAVVPVAGNFQVINIMLSIFIMHRCGFAIENIMKVLPHLKAEIGRMQEISTKGHNYRIFVDFAHTPDALSIALSFLRGHCKGKLWVLFGCGGQRDQEKRPKMGQVAAKLADYVIVTDDNPRGEEADLIRQGIIKGTKNTHQDSKLIEIAGRDKAVKYAINNLASNDILLLAGKGHESQISARGMQHHFSDIEYATSIIKNNNKKQT